MAELVTQGEATTVDLHPFRLGRFAEGDPIVGTSTACRRSSATGSDAAIVRDGWEVINRLASPYTLLERSILHPDREGP